MFQVKTATLYNVKLFTTLGKYHIIGRKLKYIDPNIRYFNNIEELYLSFNCITQIPEEIKYLVKLNKLVLTNNRINNILNITLLISLKYLYLGDNHIQIIPDEIKLLINLEYIDLSYNRLDEICTSLCSLINLKKLNLSHNNLTQILPQIRDLSNLEELYLDYNGLTNICSDIGRLNNLQVLSMIYNKIVNIYIDFSTLTKLNKLFLIENNIMTLDNFIFSPEIILINVSVNKITSINFNINSLVNLKELNISNNNITNLPLNLINLRNISIFHFYNNPIENILNPIIQRFISRFNKIKLYNLYSDGQNVHSSSIQQSIKDSIYNLIKEMKGVYKYNYLDDTILSTTTKKILMEYSKDITVHSQLNCTFDEILQAVFLEINNLNPEKQIEVKKRLNEEIHDSIDMCFTGRISRLINSLSGYSDKVIIKISDSEEISNVILIMKSKYSGNIEEIKKNVFIELLSRGYGEETINEWTNYL